MSSHVEVKSKGAGVAGVTWGKIFEGWDHVECDLHERYGIDLGKEETWSYPWHNFERRVQGLLSVPPVLVVLENGVMSMQQTRIGLMLDPPKPPKKRRS